MLEHGNADNILHSLKAVYWLVGSSQRKGEQSACIPLEVEVSWSYWVFF